MTRHLKFFAGLPHPRFPVEWTERTYYKACSVLKVNVESPQGVIPFRWTTPDRWPHRHMWLWDSAFHAIGCEHIDPELGKDALKAVLSLQREDGFVSITGSPEGRLYEYTTQPPILTWAAWDVYRHTGDREFLECYPRLRAYVEWDLEHRDVDGLPGWRLNRE